MTIDNIIASGCDFKYLNTLCVEYIEKLDCNILYVPDEYKPDPAQTLLEVKELLKSRNLTQVDIAVMHGAFEYQFPENLKISTHSSQEYNELVKTIIFIGHVHTHSRSGKIFAQGSFDRLRHGEEEPKGYAIAEIKGSRATPYFIENKNARIFSTVKLYGKSLEDSAKILKKAINGKPIDLCIRIEAEPGNPIFSQITELQKLYPTVTFTKLLKDSGDKDSVIETVNEFDEYQAIDINSTNLIELVVGRLDKSKHTEDEIQFIKSQLEELL